MSAKLMIAASMIVALTPVMPVGAQDVSTFDSAGVLLGQNVDETSAALTQQGFRVERSSKTYKLAPDRPYVSSVRGHKDDDVSRETVVVRFDEPPSEARAFLVWRSISYKPGKAPTLQSYRAAVRGKAGNETYWRDLGTSVVEQYVQWSHTGKKRGGLFNMMDSLPSSYPNACVTGIAVRSPQEALAAQVRLPDYSDLNGKPPPSNPSLLVPQAHCASGLLIGYRVPDRATGLVPDVTVLLLDQTRMFAMAEKRNKWLEKLQAAAIEAAKKGSGIPVL